MEEGWKRLDVGEGKGIERDEEDGKSRSRCCEGVVKRRRSGIPRRAEQICKKKPSSKDGKKKI